MLEPVLLANQAIVSDSMAITPMLIGEQQQSASELERALLSSHDTVHRWPSALSSRGWVLRVQRR